MSEKDILSPLTGSVIKLEQVDDQVFSSKLMGNGFAVEPTGSKVVSPVDGKVIALQGHAFGVRRPDGLEVLVHLGLDTVSLNGKPFTWDIKEGQEVKAGQKVASADWKQVKAAGLLTTTMVVITNTADVLEKLTLGRAKNVTAGEKVATATAKKLDVTAASHTQGTGGKYDKLSADIIQAVGGAGNVDHLIHCITRLRFYLKDHTKADDAKIESLNGVAGVNYDKTLGQYQVVIGPAVTDVYDEVVAQLGDRVVDEAGTDAAIEQSLIDERKSKNPIVSGFQALIGTITGSMIPIIGILAAGGMLNGFLSLFSNKANFPWIYFIDPTSNTFTIIQSMAMAPFYFLPILVGFSAAQQLKSDPLVVASIGAFLVKPDFINLTNPHIVGGKIVAATATHGNLFGVPLNADFFGLPINIPSYAYSIFPIIFAAWLARPVGNWLKKVLPLVLRSIFQPLFTIFIVGSVVLVLVGPIISLISKGISIVIDALLNYNLGLSGLIIGMFYQAIVIFGLHWMVVPLIANEIAQTGQSNLNMLVNFTMIAQGAGAMAVFFKTRNKSLKGISGAATLSAYAGITEPAIYGVNLKYGRVFWMASVGSAIGSALAGFLHLHMYGFTGSVIGFPSFAKTTDNPNNFWIFWLATIVTIVVSFVMVWLFGYKNSDDVATKTVEKTNAFKDAVSK